MGIWYGSNPETQEDREARYLLDRTCLACGDTSGWPHDCAGYPEDRPGANALIVGKGEQ
jgi:hypothetical protein